MERWHMGHVSQLLDFGGNPDDVSGLGQGYGCGVRYSTTFGLSFV